MALLIPVILGSVRSDRQGIRAAATSSDVSSSAATRRRSSTRSS